jgi:hypothetical protein
LRFFFDRLKNLLYMLTTHARTVRFSCLGEMVDRERLMRAHTAGGIGPIER